MKSARQIRCGGILPGGIGTLGVLFALPSCAGEIRTPAVASACVAATIEGLWARPQDFAGRRVCLSGVLDRMVAYGEDSPKLYGTREDAESGSQQYVTLGVRMTVETQERLARHSLEPLRAEGVFEFDSRCWPQGDGSPSDFTCFPERPMRIAQARLSFPGQGPNARVAARNAAASSARATRRSRASSPSERRGECGQGPSDGCEGD
jgi:hypothetical protein